MQAFNFQGIAAGFYGAFATMVALAGDAWKIARFVEDIGRSDFVAAQEQALLARLPVIAAERASALVFDVLIGALGREPVDMFPPAAFDHGELPPFW
jgi:hypothetical protein